MGIPNLNRFLLSNCSAQSIGKKHLSIFSGKTIVIDTSIYMYKFLGNNSLIESMYQLITIFKYYRVIPVFIFDGKPPNEKRDILEKRYYDAPGEADQLCAKMVINKEAWACMSDDMDMFVYGCTRVLRHISLLNHTVMFYSTTGILRELDIPMQNFREILIISGTDYNHSVSVNINDIVNQYRTFALDSDNNIPFNEWLRSKSLNSIDPDTFKHVYKMFHITDVVNSILPVKSICNITNMKNILHKYGFVFV